MHGRLLRLELGHNAMLWVVPIVAALFYLDTYRMQTFTGASCGSNPAQPAIRAALLKAAGLSIASLTHHPGGFPQALRGPAYATAMRFASMPAATRRAWLQTHLAGLRAGRLTIAQLP